MYLIIHDDGSLQSVDNLEPDTLKAAEDGYIDIVIYENDKYYSYGNNEWKEIK